MLLRSSYWSTWPQGPNCRVGNWSRFAPSSWVDAPFSCSGDLRWRLVGLSFSSAGACEVDELEVAETEASAAALRAFSSLSLLFSSFSFFRCARAAAVSSSSAAHFDVDLEAIFSGSSVRGVISAKIQSFGPSF